MAQRGDELNTRLTATDDASKVVDKVAEKVEDLEDQPHVVEVGADTAKAEAAAKALDARLDGLTNDEKRVVLDLQARKAQREIDQINRSLANASEYDDDEISLRVEAKGNAEAKLQAIQSEIREIDGATPKVEVEVDRSALDDLVADLPGIGGQLSNLGGRSGVSAAGAGIGALAVGLALAANNAADTALAAKNLSTLTGDSVEQASRLNAVWSSTGLDVKDLQDVLLQMGGVLNDDVELVAQLGINLQDGRTGTERLVQVTELLAEKYADAGERGVVASRLFGEEGVRQVNQVLNIVGDLGDALDDVSDRQVFSQADVDDALEYKKQVSELKAEFGGLATEIGQGVVPALIAGTRELGNFVSYSQNQFTNAGRTIRRAFDTVTFGDFSDQRDANEEYVRSIEAAEQAARDFDRSLLDQAKTAADVRQITKDYGLELESQNLIVVEWAANQRDAAEATSALGTDIEAMGYQARLAHNELAGMMEGGFRLEDLEAFRTSIGLTADELRGLKDAADPTWTQHLADLERLQGVADGAPGYFSELEEAARNASGAVDEVTTSLSIFDQERARLAEEETAARIVEQFDRQRQAAVDLADARNEGGQAAIDAERNHQDEVRRTTEMLLDYLETLEDVPDEKVTQIVADIKAGNLTEVERKLNELTKNRLVEIVAEIKASITSGLQNVSATFAPGQAPTVVVNPTVRPPETIIYDQRTTNYLTSNPTDATANLRRYDGRNTPV